MKLAIHGGKKTRSKNMPSRFSFGPKENLEIKKMVAYYRSKGEDPKYSGLWEKKFCSEFSRFMGGGYSDAVATGTGAIYVAMKALEIPKNSDVIMSPVTCSGNFSCITEQGLNPVLVDSEVGSYNTSLKKIKERITKKTKLIQLTHVGGEPVNDVLAIARFAKKNKIYLLEDCSQCTGAKIKNKFVGSFGDIAAFSTMYRKNLAANSSSGIVFTKNYRLFKKVLAYADRGKILWNEKLDLRDPRHSLFPALNWNTDEFSCAMGLASLRRLSETNKKRIQFVKILINILHKKDVKSCKVLNFHEGYAPFFLPILYNKSVLKISKKNFANTLFSEGIPLGINYGCLVSTWNWAKKYLNSKFKSVNAIKTRDDCFHLYLHENYGIREAKDIVKAILKIESFYKKNI
jgi:perosamine synthetase